MDLSGHRPLLLLSHNDQPPRMGNLLEGLAPASVRCVGGLSAPLIMGAPLPPTVPPFLINAADVAASRSAHRVGEGQPTTLFSGSPLGRETVDTLPFREKYKEERVSRQISVEHLYDRPPRLLCMLLEDVKFSK